MTDATTLPPAIGRVALLDVTRTVALIGMAIYHTVFILEMFGYLAPYTATTGLWALFARAVASSFLILVGIGLWLAHRGGIRWRQVARRTAQVGGAAALVSVATWFAYGDLVIWFGILHCIALASLVGLAILRWPAWVLVVLSVVVFALPRLVRFDALSGTWTYWLGLGTAPVRAADFLPVFPWFAPVFLGIAIAKVLSARGLWLRLGAISSPAIWWLGAPGRHSLIIYLVHIPIIFAIIWTVTQVIR
jgi:uncharacterized membrane protein